MPEKESFLELQKGLEMQTGVKEVRLDRNLFLIRLVPGGRKKLLASDLRKFFIEEKKRLGLRAAEIKIDRREIPIFDPPL